MILEILAVTILAHSSGSLLGYDCEKPYPNGTVISLLDASECGATEAEPLQHRVYVELLQRPGYTVADVLACRAEVDDTYETDDEPKYVKTNRYYLPIALPACLEMHTYGKVNLLKNTFSGLAPNVINSRLVPRDNDPDETPAPMRGVQGPNTSVKTYIHISFKRYSINIDLFTDKVPLPCKYRDLRCVDDEGYHNYWSPLFHSGCNELPYSVRYRGLAEKLWTANDPVAYSMIHNDKQLTLLAHARHEACNTTAYQMDHPRLVIREIVASNRLPYVNKLRSFVEVTSPYYYVTRNISAKLAYTKIIVRKCERELLKLDTAISLAYSDPNSFAYAVTGTPGYTARIRGEAAHLLHCMPVPVLIRPTGSCFQELPVTANGVPMYLRPRTRTLTSAGTEVACDPETTAIYSLRNLWHTLTPHLGHVSTPELLNPRVATWGQPQGNRTLDGATALDGRKEEETAKPPPRSSVLKIAILLGVTISIAILAEVGRTILGKRAPPTKSTVADAYTDAIELPEQGFDPRTQGTGTLRSAHLIEAAAESTYGTSINERIETLVQPLKDSRLASELNAVKKTLDLLEQRLDRCTHPMHRPTRDQRASRRNIEECCSDLNEGGVTSGVH